MASLRSPAAPGPVPSSLYPNPTDVSTWNNLKYEITIWNNFRKLNQVSEFDSYPMPWLDDLIKGLGRARFISTLDLTKSYWQVALSSEAKPKTAFSTTTGQWQYRVLPFGLHRAPTTFQQLMGVILCYKRMSNASRISIRACVLSGKMRGNEGKHQQFKTTAKSSKHNDVNVWSIV